MEEQNDHININLAKEDVFRDVFDTFYIPLCLFANKYVENDAVAADIVQDCFVKLWQIRTDFFYLHQVKSFLYTSVRNKALNELEHNKVVDEYAHKFLEKEKESFFHDHLIEQETYRVLTEAIDRLPPQTAAVMRLAMEGMKNAKIAESLGVSEDTVKTLKKNAYKKLRVYLKEYYYLIFLFV
ncbi:RNA polymerase sigma-70 factor (family 1) [Parabacteroides sp. PFB2-12]|uniref:RNA polymerase sigma-70 factor n=1 Tax=unclassified Parabacteroides TaxID=2649774 RepID=UPI002474B8A5|nr:MULTISPECIES: RNA polymerase sigma-70 factor [unclassified Parabacteroides]MDH6343221.1 RNA polymerase sigma-70 factor (family 1) [Parabacteroides sp. PM6-13]MDH6392139.1 RNA polymerase sigma-70 factor (family 1) [Parabacteroides sp. PFB2-12]